MAAKARKQAMPAPSAPPSPPPPPPPAAVVDTALRALAPDPRPLFWGKDFRLFEWMTALMMVGISLIVMLNPKSIQFGGFYLVAEIGLTAAVLGVIFMLAGVARVAALIANGTMAPYGAALRAAGALVGLAIWVQMLYALTLWSIKNGYLSIGVSVYLFLAIGEGISTYRAAADGRSKPS